MDYFFVLLFTGMAAAMVGVGLLASRLVAPHRSGGVKNEPYECGEKTVGRSWIHFNVGYCVGSAFFCQVIAYGKIAEQGLEPRTLGL